MRALAKHLAQCGEGAAEIMVALQDRRPQQGNVGRRGVARRPGRQSGLCAAEIAGVAQRAGAVQVTARDAQG